MQKTEGKKSHILIDVKKKHRNRGMQKSSQDNLLFSTLKHNIPCKTEKGSYEKSW